MHVLTDKLTGYTPLHQSTVSLPQNSSELNLVEDNYSGQTYRGESCGKLQVFGCFALIGFSVIETNCEEELILYSTAVLTF